MKVEIIALVEIGGSHDECLLTQFSALKKAGHTIVFITTQDVFDRNPHFSEFYDRVLIVDLKISKWKRRSALRKILSFLKKENVSKAIFNTAQGGNMRRLCLMALFSKIEFIGVLHTLRMLDVSSTQKIIHKKIKKYFFLSEHLLSKAKAPKGIRLDYFYPIRFHSPKEKEGKEDRLMITIIGGVENRRKDLTGFIEMIKGIDDSVHFTFLGKSNANDAEVIQFKKQLEQTGKLSQVTFYDTFVSHEEFDKKILSTDAILPLVHPETRSAEQYFVNQISGATTVAFGYHVPLLIHSAYREIEEMQLASIYYSKETFSESIIGLSSELKKIEERMRLEDRFNVAYQEDRFLKHVFS